MIDNENNEISTIHFLNEPKLFNEILNNSGEILAVDFRKKDDFENASFTNYSLNLPYDNEEISDEYCSLYNPKSWEDKSNDEVKGVIKRMRRFFIVIVFSNEQTSKEELNQLLNKLKNSIDLNEKERSYFKALLFYNMLTNNKFREVGIFIDNYNKFLNDFDHLIKCTYNSDNHKKIFNDPYPSSILDHRLYVGDESHVKSEDVLAKLKITHIINVTMHAPNYYNDRNIKYLNIRIEDDEKNSVISHFKEAYDFIDEAFFGFTKNKIEHKGIGEVNNVILLNDLVQFLFRKELNSENRVLIHCSLGVSRSPSIALMYIMKKFHMKLTKALELIKYLRIKSCPIQSFLNDLEMFEKKDFRFD